MDLQTELGKGTSFHVYLPAAEATSTAISSADLPHELWGHGEMVMVVDDEQLRVIS